MLRSHIGVPVLLRQLHGARQHGTGLARAIAEHKQKSPPPRDGSADSMGGGAPFIPFCFSGYTLRRSGRKERLFQRCKQLLEHAGDQPDDHGGNDLSLPHTAEPR